MTTAPGLFSLFHFSNNFDQNKSLLHGPLLKANGLDAPVAIGRHLDEAVGNVDKHLGIELRTSE